MVTKTEWINQSISSYDICRNASNKKLFQIKCLRPYLLIGMVGLSPSWLRAPPPVGWSPESRKCHVYIASLLLVCFTSRYRPDFFTTVGSEYYRKQYAEIYQDQIKSKITVNESITFLKYSGSRLKMFRKSFESFVFWK